MRCKNTAEQRKYPRSRKSGAVVWRHQTSGPMESGWLLERSESGLAFAWRGAAAPAVDSMIVIAQDGDWQLLKPTHAIVRRVEAVHDDMKVVGVEVVHLNSFPPAAARESLGVGVETKWEPPRLSLVA